MPWKLLAFIAIMTVVLVFVGFNLDNRCDISVVFFVFRSVPVVITILAAYLLGLLSAFFLAVGRRGGARSAGKAVGQGAGKAVGRTVARTVADSGERGGSSADFDDEPEPPPAAPSRSKRRPKP